MKNGRWMTAKDVLRVNAFKWPNKIGIKDLYKAYTFKEWQYFREGFACDFGETTQVVNVVKALVLGLAGVPVRLIEIFVLDLAETAYHFGLTVTRAAKLCLGN